MTENSASSKIKTGLDALEKLGPDVEATDVVQKSLFGRWISQSTAAIRLIASYLIAVGLIHYLATRFVFLGDESPSWYWALYALPLILVAVCLLLPSALKTRRERRLFQVHTAEVQPEAGYYRLYPYDQQDAARFERPDNVLEEVTTWLTHTEDTVLYLTGASGSGKSSLVAAGIIPKFESQGWDILELRGMGSPLATLTRELHEATHLFVSPPPESADALALLSMIEKEREEAEAKPLLIVLDQFEEYLILESGEEKQAYATFLKALADNPSKHIRLLHIFRSDYRAQIFKQDLPDNIPRRNGFELASFNRREAQSFLEGGPRLLDPSAYNALFKGIEAIEGIRGEYRPITLNMIGFVLEREGEQLSQEPGKLIERYLRDRIATGDVQDSAQPVLDTMITDQGTKASLTESDIATNAKLESWQVRATLEVLRNDGLVRQVNQRWEISHDFLANVLARMFGRLQKPWWRSINTTAVAWICAIWLVGLGLAIPLIGATQREGALAEIRTLKIDRISVTDHDYAFRTQRLVGDESLVRFQEIVQSKGLAITWLDLSNSDGITDLSPLSGMPLTWLDLSNSDGITDLSPLSGMPLTSLDLAYSDGITDLSPLSGMPLTSLDLAYSDGITDLSLLSGMPLTSLDLAGLRGITDLSLLSGMPLTSLDLAGLRGITDLSLLSGMPLTSLDLAYSDGITDLSPLSGMPLTWLDLAYSDGITDLSPLSGMPLTSLDLSKSNGITDLSPLSGMPLTWLDLSGLRGITDLSPLSGMPLTWLDLSGLRGITDLSPLSGMPLTWLDLAYSDGITDLSPLSGMPLTWLDLSGLRGITDLSPLSGMPLTSLDLSGLRGITDLSPLKGIGVDISGVSKALLATLSD